MCVKVMQGLLSPPRSLSAPCTPDQGALERDRPRTGARSTIHRKQTRSAAMGHNLLLSLQLCAAFSSSGLGYVFPRPYRRCIVEHLFDSGSDYQWRVLRGSLPRWWWRGGPCSLRLAWRSRPVTLMHSIAKSSSSMVKANTPERFLSPGTTS